MVVESRSVKRNSKKAGGWGETGRHFSRRHRPFPKSCASYFRFARFNTFPSVAKCRGSWVVGRGRGSWVWVWVNVVGKKKVFQKEKKKKRKLKN